MASSFGIDRQLKSIGRSLVWSRVRLRILWGLTGLLGFVFIFSMADLFFRVGAAGRLTAGSALLLVVGATGWLLYRTFRARLSVEGVAAIVEKAHPELDNRLINYVQFSRAAGDNPFKDAYISFGAPDLKKLEYSKIKNQRAQNMGMIALAIMLAVLLLPAIFLGKAWSVAMLRVVNPFAGVQPVTLTHIIDVQPGDAFVKLGAPATITARIEGYAGHRVHIDVHPDDSTRSSYDLGKLPSAGIHEFSYVVPRVNTSLRYRFKAGDAVPSDWYKLTARAPPALTKIRMQISPPGYTHRERQVIDARKSDPLIPFGSMVQIAAEGTSDLQFLRVTAPNSELLEMLRQENEGWAGSLFITEAGSIVFASADSFGSALRDEVAFRVEPDHPPSIELVAPSGRGILSPGESPQITFNVADDYGITEIIMEEISPNQREDVRGTVLTNWPISAAREARKVWIDERYENTNNINVYRIIAKDNNPFTNNITISRPVIFSKASGEKVAKQREELEEKGLSGIKEVVELQRANIEKTRAYGAGPAETGAAGWNETIERQTRIRKLTRDLLQNPIRPLGGQTETVQKLFLNEMPLAIEALGMIPLSGPEIISARISEAVRLQEAILRGLTASKVAADRAASDRLESGVTALLQALVDKQGDIIKQVNSFIETHAKIPSVLVRRQDTLASDVSEFMRTCKRDAVTAEGTDPAFAKILTAMADESEKRAVRNDMMMASERLEQNTAAAALPFADKALASLAAIQTMLEGVQVQQQQEDMALMCEALDLAREKVEKVNELHQRMIEAMDAIKGSVDKNDEEFDTFMEEYTELVKNTKEALLTVPTDLHIFTDLNVGNEMIEDVFSVFEEVEQVAGSENKSAKDIVPLAYVKEKELVEGMTEITKEIEDIEKWLSEKPEANKVDTEAHDKEEMPESGIALGPLKSQVEDLIGELLEESEEMAEEAEDSATTHAMPDSEAGWEALEGDVSSFSADGVSGNQKPDHKEQDGRSIVGREGMSVGETAANSGTISEGDEDIEARRTEDPTQSGQADIDGEGNAAATGGGKLATGKAENLGMSGGTERRESTEAGSQEGMEALLAKQADAIYAQASLQKVKAGSLVEAAHHLRQASDAVADGRIQQVSEFRNLAVSALRKAQIELDAGPSGSVDITKKPDIVDSFTGGGPDLAPRQYRDAVSDYYKLLNESL